VTAPRTILWRIALLAGLVRVALESVGLVSAAMHGQPVAAHWLGLWWQWDAHPYLRIAQAGYRTRSLHGGSPFDQYYLGFFPFYPMAVKAFAFALRSRLVSGLVVSYVASVFASWFLYLLVRIDGDHDEAWRAVLLLITFPTAYFLSAPYSEALFLFGVTGSVYAARTARWGRAGLAGAVATGTRLQGLALVPALVAEAFRGTASGMARMRRLVWAAFTVAGFGVFLVINRVVAHDAFRYFTLQRTHWFQTTVWPWIPVTTALGSLAHGTNSTLAFVFVTRLAAMALAVPLLAIAVKRLPLPDWVYGWAGFVPLLCTGWLTALPRFLLGLYPLFIVSAQLTRSRRVFVPVVLVGAGLQGFLFWRFAAGEWTF
jgi:hypothetical protein